VHSLDGFTSFVGILEVDSEVTSAGLDGLMEVRGYEVKGRLPLAGTAGSRAYLLTIF